MSIARDLMRIIMPDMQRVAAAPTHQATVLRRDAEGTLWVHIPGGAEETPVNGTELADALPGDTVVVRIEGGQASVEGNATAPAVGAAHVEQAVSSAVGPVSEELDEVREGVGTAQKASGSAARRAEEAKAIASATGQHVWHDEDGEHITEVEREAWEDDESEGYHAGANLLLNALGMLLRDGLSNLVSLTRGATTFFDGEGNAAANVVATFGADGATVGKEASFHTITDTLGMTIKNGVKKVLSFTRLGTGDNLAQIQFGDDPFDSRITAIGSDASGETPRASIEIRASHPSASATTHVALVAARNSSPNEKTGILEVNPDESSISTNFRVLKNLFVNGVIEGSLAATYLTGTIDAARLPTVPITKGGTGTTEVTSESTTANIVTAASGVTLGSCSYRQWGKVAMIVIDITVTDGISVPANGNVGNKTLATVASGKRPAQNVSWIDDEYGIWGYISTSGAVSLRGADSRNVAYTRTGEFAIRATYLLP